MRAPAIGLVVIVCCGGSSKPGDAPPGLVVAPMLALDASSVVFAPDIADAGGVTHVMSDDGDPTGPKLCGCGLCDPIVSTDRCKTDGDCAPASPCHATSCVGKAKSVPRTPATMCTQDMRCATSDANACGCLKGFCSLYKK